MKKYIICLILIVPLLGISSSREIIAPGLSETALWNYLISYYKTSVTLGYTDARDVLYSEIDAQPGNQLEGIYSGYTVTLDPDEDPSTSAYQQGINCEHTWPQSYGASEEPQRSDMHHLYPSKDNVNSSRSNAPYNNIPDSNTDYWYRLNQTLTSIPTSNIDEYSEKENDGQDCFEPREEVKGNIARSMFYIYTMYYYDIQNSFMDSQMDVLYEWHLEDPADDDEIERTWAIAAYQQNKPNPFVIDDSLIERLWYYQGIEPQITLLQPNGGETWFIGNQYDITWESQDVNSNIDIYLMLMGQELTLAEDEANDGSYFWTIPEFINPGSDYMIRVTTDSGEVYDQSDDYFSIIQQSSSDDFVIISEYVEGSGYNKAVEIFNGSSLPLNLDGWSLKKQTNGAGAFEDELLLSGLINPWDVFVICYDNNGVTDLTGEDFVDMPTSSYCMAFNGNDAIALYYEGEMIDLVGLPDVSSDWGRDVTLVRQSSINQASLNFSISDWVEFPQDTFSYLGDHSYDSGIIYGDLDGNSTIEAYDASLVLQYIVLLATNWQEWQLIAADVDGSGEIDSYDASLILRYVSGMISQFPVE